LRPRGSNQRFFRRGKNPRGSIAAIFQPAAAFEFNDRDDARGFASLDAESRADIDSSFAGETLSRSLVLARTAIRA
jgi:hypothetical protein